MASDKHGPITKEQILSALKYSGFPLEIRLLQAFLHGGFDPLIGHRFIPGNGEPSAEVDLIATASAPLGDNRGFVHLKAMVEAKQLNEGAAFVGFSFDAPSPHQMRAIRMRFSGAPTCLVVDDLPDGPFTDLLLGESGIAEALDPLNDAPFCPQWSCVRATSRNHAKQFPEAAKEEIFRQSFAKLVRVTTWLECDHALFLARNPGSPPALRIELLLPTIVIGAPTLHVYDARTGQLTETRRFILSEMHEANGALHHRYVDVVTESEVPALMALYRRVAEELRVRCDRHSLALAAIAHRQYLAQIETDSEDSEGRPTIFTS